MNRLPALGTTAAGTLLLLTLLFGSASTEAQPYRQWVDTTLPAMIVPDMFTADTTIPLFLHILTFPDAYPVSNMWDYAEVMNVDYLHRWLYKDGDWAGRDTRYDDMLAAAPAGKGVLVWLGYPSYNGSFLGQCARAREVLFFPFDSSHLRRAPVKTIDPREWVFTHYEYDTVVRNPSMIIDGDTASEALYEPSLIHRREPGPDGIRSRQHRSGTLRPLPVRRMPSPTVTPRSPPSTKSTFRPTPSRTPISQSPGLTTVLVM